MSPRTLRSGTVALFVSLLNPDLPEVRAQSHETEKITVQVRSEGEAVSGARVTLGGVAVTTDAEGRVFLERAAGDYDVTVEADGFVPAVARAVVVRGSATLLTIDLEALEEEVIVSATRSSTRLEDQALRVEVIDREEIEEKALMTPGSVAMLLGETTGLRVQTTGPSMGASNVRIQGLRGHYSQLLADGLPLYGAQGDSYSLLQVPPLDLGQVEVIKGVASALYGTSALGGVVNLVSRRPRENENELLLNATTLDGIDTTAWVARPATWSWSVLGGYHGQSPNDVDGDGWTDSAGFDRVLARPRLTFDDERGTSVLITGGFTNEKRVGGTVEGRRAPDGLPFEEELVSRHFDVGSVAKWFAGKTLLSVRGSAVRNESDRTFGTAYEEGVRSTWFGEASATGTSGRHTWVGGVALQQDRLRAPDVSRFDFTFTTPAVFIQDELRIGSSLTLAGSVRVDDHSEYGTFVSPRASILSRPGEKWVLRASIGGGSYAPTPFNEETDETGLLRLQTLTDLKAERAWGGSADATFHHGPFELSGTFFASSVKAAVQLTSNSATTVALRNLPAPTRTHGTEFIARYRKSGLTVMATHAWTQSIETDLDEGERRVVPLTPKYFASLNLMYEKEGKGGAALEAYTFGPQALEDDPSLETSRTYVLLGALLRRNFGKVLVFLNAENLLDVRQTDYERVVLPSRRADGRWLVDAWAPFEGRVFNAGIRVSF